MRIMPPLCIAALLACAWPSVAQAPPPVPRLSVCGKAVSSSPPLAVREGVLVGSWADCARAAGATAAWDPDTEKMTILSARGKRLTIGAGATFTVERETRSLTPAAVVVEREVVAPLKPLFEALDATMNWDSKTQTGSVWGRLLKLEAHGDEAGVAITMVTSLPAEPALQSLKSPRKAYVDLPNTILGDWRETTYLNQYGVLRLRCAQYTKQPPKARIVVDLRADGPAAGLERREDGCGGRMIFGRLQGDEPLLDRARPKLLKVLSGSPEADTAIVTAFVSDPVEPGYDVLRQPYRVLVDLPGTDVPGASADLADGLPFVENLRLLEQGRLVLYMKELVPFSIRKLTSPERLQIIFKREKLAGKKIMVDAGHGGKDPGAVGRTLQEKTVNLDVAKRTASRLAMMDAKPYLTRDSDDFIDLYARPRMTNELPADLFVSIHCNAAARRDKGSGTQTYYCHPQSKELAIVMQDALAPALRRKDGGVHQARFCVIRETQIPAILVELLFIDNKNEEALLAKSEVRQSAALAICEGIRRYLEGTSSRPPTLLQEPSG